jgi:predicted enzyme related to lactoylglutathione lyase
LGAVGTRESYPRGTFCWVDLVTSDAAAAKSFYGGLLGWETPAGERYAHAVLGGRDVAGVYQMDGVNPHWTSYVAVDDADAVAARAVQLGGSVAEPAFDVGDDGRRAVLADPVGARFALWQPAAHPGAGLVNDVGCWCSNQLQAPDPSPAVAFYRDLLGWEVDAEGDSYWAIRNAGADNGGMLAEPGPPAWLVYFHVSDAAAAAAAAAEVLVPPTTIGIGRVAVVTDPQGAVFGIFEGDTDA